MVTASLLSLQLERREVRIDGVPVRLGARAFDVLQVLAARAGQSVSKAELLDRAWPGLAVEENNLEVQVSTLRRLLGREAILTVAGRGYRFVLAAAPTAAASAPVVASEVSVSSALEQRFVLPRPEASHNLPQALTSFIGRDADLTALLEHADRARLLTLTGSGGCGKTRLALALAHALLSHHEQVRLVELAALTEPALVPQAVLRAFGLRELPGPPAIEQLSAHLASRSVLLLLDNAEHLLDACAQLVGTLLSRCAGLSILVTSRSLLGITGEASFRVPSLTLPDVRFVDPPERLLQSEAARLFVERARLHRADFVVHSGNARQVARVCVRLDGIPLAIELAAARLRSLSLGAIAERLDQGFELLVGGSRTALPRHQTLRALIDWSHDLLDMPERRLFMRLAVFSEGFSLEAAEAVCSGIGIEIAEVLPLVTALADHSLLNPDLGNGAESGIERESAGSATRYRLLATVAQYASERLTEAGEPDAWRRRHLAHRLEWLEQEAEAGLKGAEQGAWLARLETEHDNLRAVLHEALLHDVGSGLRLVAVLWRFWSNRGHAKEGLAWARRLLAAAREDEAGSIRARALHGAGVMAYTLCDYPAADAFHNEALALRREPIDEEGVADSLHCLSASALMQGHYEHAEALATECLAMRRKLGNARSLAGSLNNLAGLAAMRGDLAAAEPLYEEAVRLHRAGGNDHGIALGLVNLGVLACSMGSLPLAAQRHEEALAIHRALADRRAIAMDLVHLGRVALASGNTRNALARYGECLASVREEGDPLCIAELLQGIARFGLRAETPRDAARLLGAAEKLREDIGAPIEAGDRAAHESAVAALRAGVGDDAEFERALREGRAIGVDEALVEARGLLSAYER